MGIILIVVGLTITVIGAVMTFKPKEKEQIVTVHKPQKTDVPFKSEEKDRAVRVQEPEKPKDPVQTVSMESGNDSKMKGNNFEGCFADILKEASCRIIEWNQGATSPNGAYAENELKPDFLVGQKARGLDLRYWVECKFRTSLPKEGFSLKEYQVARYSDIQRDSKQKVVIALGVGGNSGSPDNFYIIPLDSLSRFKRIGHKYLDNYKVSDPVKNFGNHMEVWFFEDVFKNAKRK